MKHRKIVILLLAIVAIAAGITMYKNRHQEEPKTEVISEPEVVIEEEPETEKKEEETPSVRPKTNVIREIETIDPKEARLNELKPDFAADLQRSKEIYKLSYTNIEVGPRPIYLVTEYPNNESVLFVASTDRVSKVRFKNNNLTLINSVPLRNNKRFTSEEMQTWIKNNNPNAEFYSDDLFETIKSQRPVCLVEGNNRNFYVSQGHQIFAFADEEEEFHLSATEMTAIFSLPAKLKSRGDYIISLKKLDDGSLVFLTKLGLLGKVNERLKKFQQKRIYNNENWNNTLLEVGKDKMMAVSDRGIYTIELDKKLENSIVNRTPLHVQSDFPVKIEMKNNHVFFRIREKGVETDLLHVVTLGEEPILNVYTVDSQKLYYLEQFRVVVDFVDAKQQNGELVSITLSEKEKSFTKNWHTGYPVNIAVQSAKDKGVLLLRSVENYRRLEALDPITGKLKHSITQENNDTMIPFSSRVYRLNEHIAIYGSLFKMNAIQYYLPQLAN